MIRPALALFCLVTIGSALGCSAATTSASSSATKSDAEVVSVAEIRSQDFRNAYEVVQRLRPTWLTKNTAPTRLGMTVGGGGGVQTDSGSGLLVYLDNTRLGGVNALRDITVAGIGSIEYMDAAKATATLPGIGSSAVSGAIVVHSRTGG